MLSNDKLNYIYVENPYFFNLGYTRNLYKYLNLSENIMFIDCDIPIEKKQIDIMVNQLKEFDIVKPYDKQLIYLTRDEKYNYIKKPFTSNKMPDTLFTITGGITIFKKNVLEECGGYEELNCYAYEDRFLDVIVLHKGYKIKKNEFNLIHLWHPKLFNVGEETNWNIRNKKCINFNKKYYNCLWGRAKDFLHDCCNHKTEYIDELIEHKKNNNFNLNLFKNNKFIDSIIMKEELDINNKLNVNNKLDYDNDSDNNNDNNNDNDLPVNNNKLDSENNNNNSVSNNNELNVNDNDLVVNN